VTSQAFKYDEDTVKLRALMEAGGLLEAAQAFLAASGTPTPGADLSIWRLTVAAKKRAVMAAIATVAPSSGAPVVKRATSADSNLVRQYRPLAQAKLVDLGLLPETCPAPGAQAAAAFDRLSNLCGKNIWTLWEADLGTEIEGVRMLYLLIRSNIRKTFDEYLLEPLANGTRSPYADADEQSRKELYTSLSGGHIRKEPALKPFYLRRLLSIRARIVHLAATIAATPSSLTWDGAELARLKSEFEFRVRHFEECYKQQPALSTTYDLTLPDIMGTISSGPMPHEKGDKKRKPVAIAEDDDV
jgi:hypothetical protein